jgi:hypothetical protein
MARLRVFEVKVTMKGGRGPGAGHALVPTQAPGPESPHGVSALRVSIVAASAADAIALTIGLSQAESERHRLASTATAFFFRMATESAP